jgi:hypothetical protein
MGNNQIKVYVPVVVGFDSDGKMKPKSLEWEDGVVYLISSITDVRSAAAMKAGGSGDRYTVTINGRQSNLFFERATDLSGRNPVIGRWFVERK